MKRQTQSMGEEGGSRIRDGYKGEGRRRRIGEKEEEINVEEVSIPLPNMMFFSRSRPFDVRVTTFT